MSVFSINTSEAKDEFTELVNRVVLHHERIILTRRGKEIAAIIPIQDLSRLENIQDKHDLQEASESLTEARQIGTISLNQLITDIG